MNNQRQPTAEELAEFQMFLKNAKDIVCKCGNTTFVQGTKLKIVSRILTGQEKDTVLPSPQFFCHKCLTELSFEQPSQSSIIS